MRIRLVGEEFFHVQRQKEGQTDRNDEAKKMFQQF